jgi:cytochrome c556
VYIVSASLVVAANNGRVFMRHVVGYGLVAFSVAALIGVGATFIPSATAQDAAAAVTERQNLMKANGAAVGKIVAFAQRNEGSAADVAQAAGSIVAASNRLPALFVAGTSNAEMPGRTRLKPEALQQKAKLDAYAATLGQRATAIQAAANANNKEGVQAGLQAMNRDACGACHTDFRAPAPQ